MLRWVWKADVLNMRNEQIWSDGRDSTYTGKYKGKCFESSFKFQYYVEDFFMYAIFTTWVKCLIHRVALGNYWKIFVLKISVDHKIKLRLFIIFQRNYWFLFTGLVYEHITIFLCYIYILLSAFRSIICNAYLSQ